MANADNSKERAAREKRAQEWKSLRMTYLLPQRGLAHFLNCSRRTIAAIERGESTPQLSLQRRFRDLRRKLEEQYPDLGRAA